MRKLLCCKTCSTNDKLYDDATACSELPDWSFKPASPTKRNVGVDRLPELDGIVANNTSHEAKGLKVEL